MIYETAIKGQKVKYHLSYNIFTKTFDALLYGGLFANCHGSGSTKEFAEMSLKIRIIQLLNKQND